MGIPTATVLGGLLSYVATSAFFWMHPLLIHKKKRVCYKAMHICHRGGSAEGYENTIRNFQQAVDGGSDIIEMDVRLTKDGQVVVFHDMDLKRLTNSSMRIGDVKFEDLPTLSVSVPIDSIPGETFSNLSWSEKDRKIPLLSEVFSQFPNVPMNIDIKDSDISLVSKVSSLIEEHKRQKITVWGSFNNTICKLCHKTNPEVGLFFSAKRVAVLVVLAFTGILPFVPIKETHYEVFLPFALKRRRLLDAKPLTLGEKFFVWLSEALLIWKPLITHLRKRGIHVYLWVCNDDEEYVKCLELGANGIMTDYPTRLHSFLDRNAQNKA